MLSLFPQLNQGNQTFSLLVIHSVEPFVSAGMIFAIMYFSGKDIDDLYSILALLIFLITYPAFGPHRPRQYLSARRGACGQAKLLLGK